MDHMVDILKILSICVCITCIHGHQCHEVCLEVRGQLWEVDSLLLLLCGLGA